MMKITVDTKRFERTLTELGHGKQFKFAVSLAINMTTEEARQRIQDSLDRDFTIAAGRERFMRSLVRFDKPDRATKDKLFAEIHTAAPTGTEFAAAGRRGGELLARHEDGGVQSSFDSRKPFFIPTKAIRRGDRDEVPRQLYPRNLRLLDRMTTDGSILPALRGQKLGKGKRLQARGLAGRSFFVLGDSSPDSKAKWGIYERTGKGRGSIRMVWAFQSRIRLRPRLHFKSTVAQTFEERFEANFVTAMARAIATARH